MRNRFAVLLLTTLLAAARRFFFSRTAFRLHTPDELGLAYQGVRFSADDGVELYGWFLPAKDRASGTILQLHGNAENISTHFASVAWLPAQGFNVFVFDYRGYGASEGVPTLEGAQKDIDAAMRTLLARPTSRKTASWCMARAWAARSPRTTSRTRRFVRTSARS